MPPQRQAASTDVRVIARRSGQLVPLRHAGDAFACGQLCRAARRRTQPGVTA